MVNHIGWWLCHQCCREVNAALYEDWCPECQHRRCDYCMYPDSLLESEEHEQEGKHRQKYKPQQPKRHEQRDRSQHSKKAITKSQVDSGYGSMPKADDDSDMKETLAKTKLTYILPLEDNISIGDQTITDVGIKDVIFDHFLALFENDKVLNQSINRTINRINAGELSEDAAQQSLKDFLTGFSILLREECKIEAHRIAVRFLRHRLSVFATRLCSKTSDDEIDAQKELMSADRELRYRWTEDWLGGKTYASEPATESRPYNIENVDSRSYDIEDDDIEIDMEMKVNDLQIYLPLVSIWVKESHSMKEFRNCYKTFVDKKSTKRWDGLVQKSKDALLRQKETLDMGKLSSVTDSSTLSIEPFIEADAAVEKVAFGFHVTWKCKCGEPFTIFVPGDDMNAAKFIYLEMSSINLSKERLACQQPRWLRNFLWSIRPQKPYILDFLDLGLLFLPDLIHPLRRIVCEPVQNQQNAVDGQVFSQQGENQRTPLNRDTNNIVQQQLRSPNVQNNNGEARNLVSRWIARLFGTNTNDFQPTHRNPLSNSKQFICAFNGKLPFLSHAEIRQPHNVGSPTDRDIMIALQEHLVRTQLSRCFRKFSPIVPYKFELYEFDLYEGDFVAPGEEHRLPYQYLASINDKGVPGCSGTCTSNCIIHDWNAESLNTQELENHRRLLKSPYLSHYVWNPTMLPLTAHALAKGFPFKRRKKLTCENVSPPEKGWGLAIYYEWDWRTFLLWLAILFGIGIIILSIGCSKYACTSSQWTANVFGIIGVLVTTMAVVNYVGKQDGTIR